jgi:hypothetical protein
MKQLEPGKAGAAGGPGRLSRPGQTLQTLYGKLQTGTLRFTNRIQTVTNLYKVKQTKSFFALAVPPGPGVQRSLTA